MNIKIFSLLMVLSKTHNRNIHLLPPKLIGFGTLILHLVLNQAAESFVLRKNAGNTYEYWASNNIYYRINSNGTPDTVGEFAAIQAGFQAWQDVTDADIAFTYDSTPTTIASSVKDDVNVIYWVENAADWEYGTSVAAYTKVWTDQITGELLEADIQLNGVDFTWSSAGEAGMLDIQNIIAHEVGHFIGIWHNDSDTETTMNPNINLGDIEKRDLAQDDINAVSFLYPVSAVSIEIVSGNNQEASQNTQLLEPLIVRVRDDSGVPLPNAFVIFDSSSGTLADTAPILTDVDGLAQTTLTLPDSAEPVFIRAVAAGLEQAIFLATSNVAPVVIDQAELSIMEDTSLTIELTDLTVSDPDNAYPADFTLEVQDGLDYNRTGNTIEPVIDYVGTLSVPLTVNDGFASSPIFFLSVDVLKDSDNDGMPDTWEMTYGLDPFFDDAVDDADSDGVTNLQEFIDGTNPLNLETDLDKDDDVDAFDLMLLSVSYDSGDYSIDLNDFAADFGLIYFLF